MTDTRPTGGDKPDIVERLRAHADFYMLDLASEAAAEITRLRELHRVEIPDDLTSRWLAWHNDEKQRARESMEDAPDANMTSAESIVYWWENYVRPGCEHRGGDAVVWRRMEDAIWVYYETEAWPDMEALVVRSEEASPVGEPEPSERDIMLLARIRDIRDSITDGMQDEYRHTYLPGLKDFCVVCGNCEPHPVHAPPEGLVCPFCHDDDFDEIGMRTHLALYCEVYARPTTTEPETPTETGGGDV